MSALLTIKKSLSHCKITVRFDSSKHDGVCIPSDAMVDIKKLNQIEKTNLQAAHSQVEPPWNVPVEMKGKTQNYPGGMNYYVEKDRVATAVNTGIHLPSGIDRQTWR